MTEENERLMDAFAKAQKKIRNAPTANEGGAGAEVQYADAYRSLVRAGLARPLRRKYRA